MMISKLLVRYGAPSLGALLPFALGACPKVSSPGEAAQSLSTAAGKSSVVDGVLTSENASPSASGELPPEPMAAANPPPPAGVAPEGSGLAIVEPTPEPLSPPPLRAPPRMPALPSLPPPAKYPKQVALPRSPDIAECGAVWSGTEYVPMECIDPSARLGAGKAAKVVVPYDRMRQPPETLPKIVDHRADGTEGPVRRQGSVPICTAMAFTAALDHAYARWTGQPGSFSVMQVWARYHARQEHIAAGNNVGALLASETEWPYDPKEARSYVACAPKHPSENPCGQAPDLNKLSVLDSRAVAQITQVEAIAPGQLDVLREKLAAGQDVVVAINLPTLAVAGEPGSKYMVGQAKDPNAKPKGSHQIVLAGYAMTPNGTYYLVHNSFGMKWGDQGYAWLHEDYLKAYSSDNLMVIPDVEPVQVHLLRSRARGEVTAACAPAQAPDSISGHCAGVCADGSPRHNNVCADANGECPSGMVNLTGECLMAAPKSAGMDTTSGVKWACGPGGCAYEFAHGALGCNETLCAVSCPAPSFRLATMTKGLVCVE
jgi:hypothetical protein